MSFLSRFKNHILKIDNKLFASFLEEKKGHFIHKEQLQYCVSAKENPLIEKPVADFFEIKKKEWFLTEFCFHHIEPFVVEPSQGWAVTPKFKFVSYSAFNRYIHRKNLLLPSFIKYKWGSKKKKTTLHTVTPLLYAWNNYFHFYNDIVGTIYVAEKLGLKTTFILPEEIKQKGYYQDFVALAPEFAKKDIYFLKQDEYVQAREGYFFLTMFGSIRNFDAAIRYINWDLLPKPSIKLAENIFIGRKSGSRGIVNEQEVRQLMQKHGFLYCNLDALSLSDQIHLFKNAHNIIGIHGAGVTNLMFCEDKTTKFIELFSSQLMTSCYWWLTLEKNIEYAALFCECEDEKPGFYSNIKVNIENLERTMMALFLLS